MPTPPDPPPSSSGRDLELVERIARNEREAMETLMRRHNGKLYRVARSILRDDLEAEDALQDAYLDAIRHIRDFRGGSSLETWLTRIVINRALMRQRAERRHRVLVPFSAGGEDDPGPRESNVADERVESPVRAIQRAEIRRLLEQEIDELPLVFRTVFVLREVEDMTMAEIAELLQIPVATVRTRLFRARRLLRTALARDVDAVTGDVFSFGGDRCDRLVERVFAALEESGTPAT